MPSPDQWHPGALDESSPVWKELVPGENRAITLSHPSYPYVDTWATAVPADLTRICAAYLGKVREILGLPSLFDESNGSFKVPLSWLPIDLEDIPGPRACVWVKRFADPVHQTGLIDRTAIVLAGQSLNANVAETALGSRLGIKIVAHVSAEAQPPWTVRITGATCSTELARSLRPYGDPVKTFFEDFFANVATRGHIGTRIRIAAQLPGHAVTIDGLRDRGTSVEVYANASRPLARPNELTYRLTARLVPGADVELVEKSPLVAGGGPVGQARLFPRDPVSEGLPGTGRVVDARPNRAPDRLEGYRVLLNLPGLTVSGGGDAHLVDDFGQVQVMQSKLVDPNGVETDDQVVRPGGLPQARMNAFAALSGYQHGRELFDTMRDYGFSPAQYFRFAGWPLHVRHRATIRPGPGKDGKTVNAQVDYDPPGGDPWLAEDGVFRSLQVRFALADLQRSASRREPLGLATDPRWSWHEYGHVLLVAVTGSLEFLFAHSVGDALAAIRSDPGSALADPGHMSYPRLRGATFPSAYLNRRHDRSVWHGWSWSGTYHRQARFPLVVENRRRKGYQSEQILSTSLFRVYLVLGGDTRRADGSPDLAVRQAAADYTVYLIMRTIKSLPPAFSLWPETPGQLVMALAAADIATQPSPGPALADKVGGCAHKVVRWAFEAQGLYAADPSAVTNAPGEPPDVDVFIDNGRPASEGGHPRGGYMPVSLDWNDPIPPWHASPLGAVDVTGNQVMVHVRNRGRLNATGVTVRVLLKNWPAGQDPPRWDPGTWASLGPSGPQTVPTGGNPVAFGPFALPASAGRRLILAEATCVADYANTDPLSGAPCATNPTPIVDLVNGDNNLGLRRIG